MGKTSMQYLIEKIMRMPESNIKNYLTTVGPEYLKQNKKEIIQANTAGFAEAYSVVPGSKVITGEQYYKETYGED